MTVNDLERALQRGWQLHQQQQLTQAEEIYRDVLRQAPGNANAWCYLGITLHDQRRYTESVDAYQRALALKSDFPIALNNLGNSLRYLNQFEEADACFQRAIDLNPNYLNAFKNRGTLHVWAGGLDRGIEYYLHALRINPGEAELHRNLGVIYLLQGRFEEGWQEYRWRWKVGDLQRPFSNYPVWKGEELNGLSLLLTAEQGLGDTLNFVRFARVLRTRGARTLVYCQSNLMALLQTAADIIGPVYPNSLPLQQNVDYQCSLLDVADVLNLNEVTIPGEVPYLRPAGNLREYWRHKWPAANDTIRVGVAWQGNPDHQADAFRSIPLKFFESLSGLPHVQLVSLQSGYGVEQIDSWQGASPLQTLDAEVDRSSGAFMDTAAIMQQLDLVITSDTAIAHLAAAMSVPTWIALSYVPDWRWLLSREDSPWYPSVRLFRQSKNGDWQDVFRRIRESLQLLIPRQVAGKDP